MFTQNTVEPWLSYTVSYDGFQATYIKLQDLINGDQYNGMLKDWKSILNDFGILNDYS